MKYDLTAVFKGTITVQVSDGVVRISAWGEKTGRTPSERIKYYIVIQPLDDKSMVVVMRIGMNVNKREVVKGTLETLPLWALEAAVAASNSGIDYCSCCGDLIVGDEAEMGECFDCTESHSRPGSRGE